MPQLWVPQSARSRGRARTAPRSARHRSGASLDGAVGVQDSGAKSADDFLVHNFSGLHELMRDGVGLNEVRPERDQHFAHHRFTGGDATGQSEFQHCLTGQYAECAEKTEPSRLSRRSCNLGG